MRLTYTMASILRVFLVGCLFVLPGSAHAATYWVSSAGEAAWPGCRSETPLDGAAACSLATANFNAVAGDTIYLRGGTYRQTSSSGCGSSYTCGIYPRNRGTGEARITYSAYARENPIITADAGTRLSRGITIHQGTGPGFGTYIRVTGITFHNLYSWASLFNYANHNEIDHCTFSSDTGADFGAAAGLSISSMCVGGSSWQCYSKHNWIHHNTFLKRTRIGCSGVSRGRRHDPDWAGGPVGCR